MPMAMLDRTTTDIACAGGGRIGLYLLVNRRVQCRGADEALQERVRTNAGSHAQ